MRATTVDESRSPSEHLYTRSFALLLATQTCYGMSFSTFFLLPKYLKVELAASEVQIGALGAFGAIAGVIAFPLVGRLNDRYGRRRFILLGSMLMTLSALAMLHVTRIDALLYLLRLMHGLSFALYYNSVTTLMSDRVAPERLGLALGVFGSALLATNALAPALAELIAARLGWQAVFWQASAWGVVSVLLSAGARDLPREHAARSSEPPKDLAQDRRARVVALAIAGAGAGFGTVFTFHQPYALALGLERVSGFFVAYAAAALFGRMLLLKRLDRADRRLVSALSMLGYGLAVAATAWLGPGVLEAVGLALGLAHGVLYPVFNALAVQGVRPRQRGMMMALYHGGFNAGMALALLVGGTIVERLGYPTLFWCTGALIVLAAWYLWRSPELRDVRLPS